jgi:hypothetical protein
VRDPRVASGLPSLVPEQRIFDIYRRRAIEAIY